MFAECKRLSDGEILFLPGEEANIALGQARPGKEAGHWLYLFPRPVYWTMKRAPGQPFVENHSPARDGSITWEMATTWSSSWSSERGLAWTSHARIKGSSWTPDFFRSQPFYQVESLAGGRVEGDAGRPVARQAGQREPSNLLDDMANWGDKKYLPGEVDVFKIDHTHELYGHMNINYIRLDPDRVPRFDESWQPVLDSLRAGRFFVTTGEVLIPEFTRQRPAERVEHRLEAQRAGRGAIPFELARSHSDMPSWFRATGHAFFAIGSTLPTQARSKSAA